VLILVRDVEVAVLKMDERSDAEVRDARDDCVRGSERGGGGGGARRAFVIVDEGLGVDRGRGFGGMATDRVLGEVGRELSGLDGVETLDEGL
jgi:hypothetical protein